MRKAIVNMDLVYFFPDSATDEEIYQAIEEVDLPDNYVTDSIDLVKIISDKKEE